MIEYVTVEDAEGEVRDILEEEEEKLGKPSLYNEILANNPSSFKAKLEYFHEVMHGGGLRREIKELAYTVVSIENRCEYCASSHGENFAEHTGVSKECVDRLSEGDYSSFSRKKAVAVFARQIAQDPKRVSSEDVEALHSAGFDEGDIIELVCLITEAMSSNALVHALNVHPVDMDDKFPDYFPDA